MLSCKKDIPKDTIKFIKLPQYLRKYRNCFSLILLAVLLIAGAYGLFQDYYRNSLHVVDDHHFLNAETLSEELIIPDRLVDYDEGRIPVWYNLYRSNPVRPCHLDSPYYSHIGFQGMFFGVVYKYFTSAGLSVEKRIEDTRKVAVSVTVIVLLILLLWMKHEFGLITASAVYIGLLYSPWLVAFSRNFYWVPGTLLLPFSVCVIVFWNRETLSRRGKILAVFSLFLAMLIRFCCGFEFASCVFFAAFIPLTYYAVKYGWSWRQYLAHILVAGLTGLAAFFSTMLLNIFQMIWTGHFSFTQAVSLFMLNITRHTGFGQGLPFFDTLITRFTCPLTSVFSTYFFAGRPVVFDWHFFPVLAVFIVSFIVFIVIYADKNGRIIRDENRKVMALFAAGAVAFFSPVSWLFLAKAHSFVHTFIVYFLFSLPTVPLMLAAPVYMTVDLVRNSIEKFQKFKSSLFLFLAIAAFAGMIFILWQYVDHSGYSKIANWIIREPDFEYNGYYVKFLNHQLYIVTDRNQDTHERFALHVFDKTTRRIKNMDFYWDKSDPIQGLGMNHKMVIKNCPSGLYQIKTFGQYKILPDKKISILWICNEQKINRLIDEYREKNKNRFYLNFSDGDWNSGYYRHSGGFLVYPSPENRQKYQQNGLVILPDGTSRKILSVQETPYYLHVFTDGPSFLTDVMPHELKVVSPLIDYYRTDGSWNKGYCRSSGGFFVQPTAANLNRFLSGKYLILSDGTLRKIIRIDKKPTQLNVFTEGASFVFDVMPHELTVLNSPADYYLTDRNWFNGYYKLSGGFFVYPSPEHKDRFKAGKYVVLPDGTSRKILSVNAAQNYLNVHTEGPAFSTDVMPHELKVRDADRQMIN